MIVICRFVHKLSRSVKLTDTTTADDVDGWESITHMMIICEIEKTFNIKFKLMDLMNMNSVGDLLESIESELLIN